MSKIKFDAKVKIKPMGDLFILLMVGSKNETTNIKIINNIKQNFIKSIAINIGKDINNNDYG